MNTLYESAEPGLDILSIGFGDIKISFDKENPQEAARAAQIIRDMMKRGYVLFVHGPDNSLHRVLEFKEETGEYIIAAGAEPDLQEEVVESKKPGRPRKLAVPMAKTKATMLGRSAGG